MAAECPRIDWGRQKVGLQGIESADHTPRTLQEGVCGPVHFCVQVYRDHRGYFAYQLRIDGRIQMITFKTAREARIYAQAHADALARRLMVSA